MGNIIKRILNQLTRSTEKRLRKKYKAIDNKNRPRGNADKLEAAEEQE